MMKLSINLNESVNNKSSIRIQATNYGFKIIHNQSDGYEITKILDKLYDSNMIDGYTSSPTAKEIYNNDSELSFDQLVSEFSNYSIYKNMDTTAFIKKSELNKAMKSTIKESLNTNNPVEEYEKCKNCEYRCDCCSSRVSWSNCLGCKENNYSEFEPADNIIYCPLDGSKIED